MLLHPISPVIFKITISVQTNVKAVTKQHTDTSEIYTHPFGFSVSEHVDSFNTGTRIDVFVPSKINLVFSKK